VRGGIGGSQGLLAAAGAIARRVVLVYAEARGLRRIFARIAADEARHGELAWDLHTWLLGQLNEEAAAEVTALRAAALRGLEARAAAAQVGVPGELGRLGAGEVAALAGRFASLLAA